MCIASSALWNTVRGFRRGLCGVVGSGPRMGGGGGDRAEEQEAASGPLPAASSSEEPPPEVCRRRPGAGL